MPQANFCSFTRDIPSQIARDGRAAMLEGHDVVRLMPQTGIVLVQLAILATSTSTLLDEVPQLQSNPVAHRVA